MNQFLNHFVNRGRTVRRTIVCVGALLVLLSASGCGSEGAGPAASSQLPEVFLPEPTGEAPAALLDLSNWDLTLPVDADGLNLGPAHTIRAQELLAGYDADWFYGSVQDNDEGITFWAPVNGAKTANSPYARSELREVLDPSDSSVNWAVTDDYAELIATVRVNQTPAENGKVTIGQIVGYNGENPEISDLFKLIFEYNTGPQTARVYGLLTNSPSAPAATTTLPIADDLQLNQLFSYVIRVENGVITAFAGGGSMGAQTIDPRWNSEGVFFRAGVALHASGVSGTDGGRVSFIDLATSHEAP